MSSSAGTRIGSNGQRRPGRKVKVIRRRPGVRNTQPTNQIGRKTNAKSTTPQKQTRPTTQTQQPQRQQQTQRRWRSTSQKTAKTTVGLKDVGLAPKISQRSSNSRTLSRTAPKTQSRKSSSSSSSSQPQSSRFHSTRFQTNAKTAQYNVSKSQTAVNRPESKLNLGLKNPLAAQRSSVNRRGATTQRPNIPNRKTG